MSKVVKGLYYANSHEWLQLSGDTALVGITDFAQSQLGTVVFVDLPEVGAKLIKGKEFGAVESVKAASDLYSPVSGTVIAINEALVGDPEQINHDAFSSWMLKVKLANPKELATLLDDQGYLAICH